MCETCGAEDRIRTWVEIIAPPLLREGWLIFQNPVESSLSQTLKRMSLRYAINVFIGLERDVELVWDGLVERVGSRGEREKEEDKRMVQRS